MPGACCTRGLACEYALEKAAHEHTGTVGAARHSLRDGLTAYSVLSPVNGSFATVAPKKRALGDFTPAPRRQDHTSSPYASLRVRLAPSASTASHRAFVTIASRPS